MEISPSYITLIVVIITAVAGLFNIKLDNAGLTVLVGEVIAILGSIYVLYRKIQHGEINIFGKYIKK